MPISNEADKRFFVENSSY